MVPADITFGGSLSRPRHGFGLPQETKPEASLAVYVFFTPGRALLITRTAITSSHSGCMIDIIYVAVVVIFFAISIFYAQFCANLKERK
jgi:hypothetical protein